MSTQMLVYLCGSLIIVTIFALWSWQRVKDEDITLSDLTFFIVISIILGLFSWISVVVWIFYKLDKFFYKLDKYGDKVIIRRKKK